MQIEFTKKNNNNNKINNKDWELQDDHLFPPKKKMHTNSTFGN